MVFEGEYINGKRKGKKRVFDSVLKKYVLKDFDEENEIINTHNENENVHFEDALYDIDLDLELKELDKYINF